MDLKGGYGWKQDAMTMKYLFKSTNHAVKMTGLITGSRKANKTHKHSPKVHAMPKPGPGVAQTCSQFAYEIFFLSFRKKDVKKTWSTKWT